MILYCIGIYKWTRYPILPQTAVVFQNRFNLMAVLKHAPTPVPLRTLSMHVQHHSLN